MPLPAVVIALFLVCARGHLGLLPHLPPLKFNVADLYGPMDDFDVIEDIFTMMDPEPESLKRQKQQHKKVSQWKNGLKM